MHGVLTRPFQGRVACRLQAVSGLTQFAYNRMPAECISDASLGVRARVRVAIPVCTKPTGHCPTHAQVMPSLLQTGKLLVIALAQTPAPPAAMNVASNDLTC